MLKSEEGTKIAVLCFSAVLNYIIHSSSTDSVKVKDLKNYYSLLDNEFKSYLYEAVKEQIELYISKELPVPKWLNEFDYYLKGVVNNG